MKTILELKDIVVSFNNTEVLKNLSGTIQQGDFVTIIGANGAGKSTLFDLIAGKVTPLFGKVLLEGNDVTDQDEQARAPMIARLFQNTHLSSVPTLTVAQNLALAGYKGRTAGLKNGMSQFPQDVVEMILRPMGLDSDTLLNKPIGLLSGGQRQIISLIMATIVPPKILLLDEPTAALDPASATKLLVFAAQFIKKHNITTLMITHDQRVATSMGNKLWVLEDGVIKREYGPEKLTLSTQHLVGEIDYEKLACAQL